MAETGHDRTSPLSGRARSVLSNAGQDERIMQAATVTKDVAARAEGASKTVARKVTQGTHGTSCAGDTELLTEIALTAIFGLDPAQPRPPLGPVRSDVNRFVEMVLTALGALLFIFGTVLLVPG